MKGKDFGTGQDQGQDRERLPDIEAIVGIDQAGIIGIVLGAEDHPQIHKMLRTADMLMFARNVAVLIKRPRKSGNEALRLHSVNVKDIGLSNDTSPVRKGVVTRPHLNLTAISRDQLLALLQKLLFGKNKTMGTSEQERWVTLLDYVQ